MTGTTHRCLALLAGVAVGLLPLLAHAGENTLRPVRQEPGTPWKAEDYLTKDGKLKQRLELREVQGGFAGYTGTYWVIETDGSWSTGQVFMHSPETKTSSAAKGQLTAAQLAGLAKVFAQHGLAELPNHGEAHVNPHILTVQFGKKTMTLLPAPGQASAAEDKAIRARYWAILAAVTAVCREPEPVRILEGAGAVGLPGKAREITTEKELAQHFGVQAQALIKKQVDFTREKLLWVTWQGSSSSYLTFDVQKDNGKLKVLVSIVTPNPALADLRLHGGLIVMPQGASWQCGGC
jgi:hypothetical protein